MAGATTPIAGGTDTTPATIQNWLGLFDNLFGTKTDTNSTKTESNSSAADNPLMAMIAQITQQLGQGGNDPAVQQLLGQIFTQLKETALPGIQGQANAGGGVYNSSTQKLLQGDALARATTQGGSLVLQHQQNLQSQLSTLLGILAKSTANVQTNQQQTQSKPGSIGNAAKGLGAAAAGKALSDLFKSKTASASGRTNTAAQGDTEGQDQQSALNDFRDAQNQARTDELANGNGDATDPFGIGGYDIGNNGITDTQPTADAGQEDTGPDLSFLQDFFNSSDNLSGFDIGDIGDNVANNAGDFGDFSDLG